MTKSSESGSSGTGVKVLKGVLLTLGALTAISLLATVLQPLFVLGLIGGAGYLGYRFIAGRSKALPAPKRDGMLTGGSDDFDRRMRDLDEASKRLDRDIR